MKIDEKLFENIIDNLGKDKKRSQQKKRSLTTCKTCVMAN